MPISNEIRRLARRWQTGNGWPKRLEWLEVHGIRGWEGQRVDFKFPIVAIVGENGSGKSTLLQAAACVYLSEERKETWFASEFFPDTAWDHVRRAEIKCGYLEGTDHKTASIRKPTTRWLGNVDRPSRSVSYVDLSRIQPLSARVGYAKIAKTRHEQASAQAFDEERVERLSEIMGRHYDAASMAISTVDDRREIPVISKDGIPYSGFHQGCGEMTITELLRADLPRYGLVLIDEIESSLHPRAQRRLIRDLADKCREYEAQIILTTHSPYILEELPLEARNYILQTQNVKKMIVGVSPQFAMTQMDDEPHPECELYVEDLAAKVMLGELLAAHAKELFPRCAIVPYGAASVGLSLGIMASQRRFARPTCVFLDGDNAKAEGCLVLPGGDAPERVVFSALQKMKWGQLWARIGRDVSWVADACTSAMTLTDHHEWVRTAANSLLCGGDTLWQGMCAEWAKNLDPAEAREISGAVEEALAR
ncbi:MAG TPA: AAA family ATPase [Rhizomicrobium sp.]|nr:AAA family ATPase [Rhizomicrobium sp.]